MGLETDESVSEGDVTKPDDLSPISGTHIVKGEN